MEFYGLAVAFVVGGFALALSAPALAGETGTRVLRSVWFYRCVAGAGGVWFLAGLAQGRWLSLVWLALSGATFVRAPVLAARANEVRTAPGHASLFTAGGAIVALVGALMLLGVIHPA